MSHDTPPASLIIPTYNRADLLRRNLAQLVGQSLDTDRFEVIVADDGSSDDTEAAVGEFRDRLRLKYHRQEDRGNRVGTARNAGARLATAPLLIFLDTGTFVGRDFVDAHLRAHREVPGRWAIVGYTYGYDPEGVDAGLMRQLDESTPDELVERAGATLRDVRHAHLAAHEFDLSRLLVPYQNFFTLNCSVAAADFAAVGGFDEDFVGWGFEDLELAYRLLRDGVGLRMSRTAWAIESPHPRDPARFDELLRNMDRFFAKHPSPPLEVGWVLLMRYRDDYWTWEDELRQVLEQTAAAQGRDVTGEITGVLAGLPTGGSLAVLGAGDQVPPGLPAAVLYDLDVNAVARLAAAEPGRHDVRHGIGLRTTLEDGTVDDVIVTSRLDGLWKRWGADLLAEAGRIGKRVHVTATAAR
ncbi:glycosyltransferase [Micromonospora sp. NPDC049004]|uniref:glycosyltransferase n=1 Tax=Micromonospora sp. NPDC049004 TaxID=3154348 RepID=UPI0033E5CF83